jgi:hypothetical protein
VAPDRFEQCDCILVSQLALARTEIKIFCARCHRLHWRHGETSTRTGAQKRRGDSGFANPRIGARDEESRFHF